MIKLKLVEVLARKRLSIVELSDRTGITVRDLEVLRDQKALALRLKTLACLCRSLGCQPGELIEYVMDGTD